MNTTRTSPRTAFQGRPKGPTARRKSDGRTSAGFGDAYRELMGADDEVDVFFILPRGRIEDAGSLLVLRVTGLPDTGQAWVH